MTDAGQSGVGAGTAAGRALGLLAGVRGWFGALPAGRRRMFVAGAVALVGLVLAGAWYAGWPDWRVLFSGLEGKDVQQVSQELAAAGIAFQTTSDGTGVEVPAELLDKARMEVAAKGMPQTGRLGFELFDKPNWVGSEFDERVNYQRALEGELEHTIGTLGVVRSARVHLVLPQASLFAAEAKAAKASVVLKLKRASLGPEQADSIRNLVAGAVENLQPEQVTLVDADGRANLQARGGGGTTEGDAEQALEARLVAMLEPLAGTGNVRATVNVAYDEGTEERTDEVYDPAGSVPTSLQKSEQTNATGQRLAQGVPGTASNTPAAAPVGAVQGSSTAAAPGTPPLLQKEALPVYPQAGNGNSTRQETTSFAVTRHMLHSVAGPGRVRRITAAVVVNDRQVSEVLGKAEHAVWKPRTQEEMHRLEGLAQAAVGFDEKRGDSVVMENVSFSSNAPEVKSAGFAQVLEQTQGALKSQPGLLRSAVLAGLGLLVVFFVLRPVAGQVVSVMREPAMLPGGRVEVLPAGVLPNESAAVAEPAKAESLPAVPVLPKRLQVRHGNAVFDQVSEHIRQSPAESTRLIESWIGSAEETD